MNKTKAIFKSIFMGLIFGSLVFFAPFFLLKTLIFFMLISFLMKMWWWRSMKHSGRFHFRFADKVRNMSEEEYTRFKSAQYHSCNYYDSYTEVKEEGNPKKNNEEKPN